MTGLKGNLLKEKLMSGEKAVGGWITSTDPALARIFPRAGFDFVLIDLEHAAIQQETLQTILWMFDGTDSCPVVRVPWHDQVWTKWALDLGAEGVLFPNIKTAGEARQVVSFAKYPPEGIRGFFPRVASNFTTDMKEYMDGINDRVLVWIQIEDIAALDQLDEIFSVPGIDGVLVGPADLSLSMEKLFQFDHPEFLAALEKILASARRHQIPVGYPVDDTAEKAVSRLRQGFQFVTAGMDTLMAQRAARSMVADIQKGLLS